jgi:hypothetical protein
LDTRRISDCYHFAALASIADAIGLVYEFNTSHRGITCSLLFACCMYYDVCDYTITNHLDLEAGPLLGDLASRQQHWYRCVIGYVIVLSRSFRIWVIVNRKKRITRC